MTMKKILAATLAAVMALSLAACGNKTDDEPAATEPDTYAVETVVEPTEAPVIEESTVAEEAPLTEAQTEAAAVTETTPATEAATEAEETTEAGKKTPETKEEIVEFYKNAAAETDKGKPSTSNKMELVELNGGSGAVGKFITMLEPIVKKTLEKNSSTDDHITGGYKNLTADDVASATATDDGKYTTVTINLKEQTDGFSADSRSGHVGHGISVLGNVQNAIDELNGVDVDASEGKVSLRYSNAQIKVKVDNETGKIVSGTWKYNCNASLNNIKAKISILSVTLDGATAVISQTITM